MSEGKSGACVRAPRATARAPGSRALGRHARPLGRAPRVRVLPHRSTQGPPLRVLQQEPAPQAASGVRDDGARCAPRHAAVLWEWVRLRARRCTPGRGRGATGKVCAMRLRTGREPTAPPPRPWAPCCVRSRPCSVDAVVRLSVAASSVAAGRLADACVPLTFSPPPPFSRTRDCSAASSQQQPAWATAVLEPLARQPRHAARPCGCFAASAPCVHQM